MKTLQNNFTTPEQSKRLLELGLPSDSADLYYQNALPEPQIIPTGRKYQEYTNSLIGINREIWYFKPCWSVGRLIEISELCYTSLLLHDYFIRQKDCNTDFLIKIFELGIDRMDFSKLEE